MMEKDRSIQLYSGDYKEMKVEPKTLSNILGKTVEIAEFEELSYQELLQISIQECCERNPYYYEDDKVTAFVYWHDNYLFITGGFDWTWSETHTRILHLPYFFYTQMTRYKDVINEEVFGTKAKICVIKTNRPILVKLVNYIKESAAIHSKSSVSEEKQ